MIVPLQLKLLACLRFLALHIGWKTWSVLKSGHAPGANGSLRALASVGRIAIIGESFPQLNLAGKCPEFWKYTRRPALPFLLLGQIMSATVPSGRPIVTVACSLTVRAAWAFLLAPSAAPADFLDFFSIEWVIEFLATYPKVKLDFVLNDARADLIGEAIDVAFRGGAAGDPWFVFREITSQHFRLVASPDYLKSRGTPETLAALESHDCLTVSGGQDLATWNLTGPNGSEEVRVTGRFSANGARSLLKSCVSGLGIALLPDIVVMEELSAGQLTHVLPKYRSGGAKLSVILPSREQIPAAVSTFVEFATAKLEALLANQGAIHVHAPPPRPPAVKRLTHGH